MSVCEIIMLNRDNREALFQAAITSDDD
jgi:hypothetical protein